MYEKKMIAKYKGRNGITICFFDTTKNIAFIERDMQEHIFNKRTQAIAMSKDLLKWIVKNFDITMTKVCCSVKNNGKHLKTLTISLKDFLINGNDIKFEGKNCDIQKECKLRYWSEK